MRVIATHLALQPSLGQARIAVAGDTFKTAAVSSTLNPPKNRISITRLFRSSNFANAMELPIERDQSLTGTFVALSPFEQQSGDLGFGFDNPVIL
jgi:hypothetical protein